MCVNCIDGICQNRCVMKQAVIVCSRCHEPVCFDKENVSPGYYAFCSKHDEDLDKWETKVTTK